MQLGVLGGGQLGRMLALAGHPLGIGCTFLDPATRRLRRAGQRPDRRRLRRSGGARRAGGGVRRRHVRVRERAGASADAAGGGGRGAPAAGAARDRPGPAATRRRCSGELGIPTRRLPAASTRRPTSTRWELPAVLKTRRLGYDGKGQLVARERGGHRRRLRRAGRRAADRRAAGAVRPRAVDHRGARPRRRGRPPTRWSRTTTGSGILRLTLAPAPELTRTLQRAGRRLHAAARSSELDYVGVLALELFAGRRPAAGQRDRAARPQLRPLDDRGRRDQPVREPPARGRSACRWARADAHRPQRHGQPDRRDAAGRAGAGASPGAHLHLYGKAPRPGRKLGHVTVTGRDDLDAAMAELGIA